jgi:signal peptidase I
VTVRGASMVPAYRHGDVVLARRCRLVDVRVGQVVVVGWPAAPPGSRHWLIKRVAAVSGDPLPSPVGAPGTGRTPPGTLVVLGDNGGLDSRTFGPLDAGYLRAVVVRRIRSNGAAPGSG